MCCIFIIYLFEAIKVDVIFSKLSQIYESLIKTRLRVISLFLDGLEVLQAVQLIHIKLMQTKHVCMLFLFKK